ncbi:MULTISPECIES: response regulator transcription factor [Cupriavidus]|uniref:response regulator transcription factor n=1 Tax=Cupriavidus TaxID=106589 RepID=UPI0003645B7A
MKIASLEDHPAEAALIRRILGEAGHDCMTFGRSREMLLRLREENFDLLLLDWHLPDLSGKEVLTWVRANLDRRVPVMFVTGRSAEEDIVDGLATGADDYMLKPVRRGELLARTASLLRRAYPEPGSGCARVALAGYVFDCAARTVVRGATPLRLTPKEFDLAVLLFRNEGRIVSRDHIVAAVWGREISPLSRTIDTHMSRVRSKLGLAPEHGLRLLPVYTHGYRLELVPATAWGRARAGDSG